MQTKYMNPRSTKRESRMLSGRFKAGKLAPVMAVALRGSESAVVNQEVSFMLDPISGRLLTDMFCEATSVFVPMQAIDELKNPADAYPGNAEAFRQKLLSETAPFVTETENEISKRLGVVPRSVGGVKVVNEVARLAYIAAVNHLRSRRYHAATQLTKTATAIVFAILSQTVLDRLNGVLDPETRVNGAVNFSAQIPVAGIGVWGNPLPAETSETNLLMSDSTTGALETKTGRKGISGFIETASGIPQVFADLQNQISLSDFYQAERMDALTREMRTIMDQNPTHGETLIARWARGLSIDLGKNCVVVGERRESVSRLMQRATDGANLGVEQTEGMGVINLNYVVPKTEFGGVIVTVASLLPDETLAEQPHPLLSKEWTQLNYAADELAIDPVAVTVRDLYADCASGDESNIALYVGNNHMEKNYIHYGFNRHVDPLTVDSETAIWQLEVPMSVTPDNVSYPDNLNQDPFADTTAEVVTYNARSNVMFATPMIFGPTPVEDLDVLDDENIFEETV